MENKNININITKEDASLYEYLKHCKDDAMIKNALTIAIDLYNYCTGKYELCQGYSSPNKLKESLTNVSKDKLLELKSRYEHEIVEWASWFDPDGVDCGVMRGPDDYWFVEECGPLGFITLYSHYLQVISELLEERK